MVVFSTPFLNYHIFLQFLAVTILLDLTGQISTIYIVCFIYVEDHNRYYANSHLGVVTAPGCAWADESVRRSQLKQLVTHLLVVKKHLTMFYLKFYLNYLYTD